MGSVKPKESTKATLLRRGLRGLILRRRSAGGLLLSDPPEHTELDGPQPLLERQDLRQAHARDLLLAPPQRPGKLLRATAGGGEAAHSGRAGARGDCEDGDAGAARRRERPGLLDQLAVARLEQHLPAAAAPFTGGRRHA